jgi:transcriptional regulator with XRE-family HTH domain
MADKDITATALAQRVREQLEKGDNFQNSNIAHYRSGRTMPRPARLTALARALGMREEELLSKTVTKNGKPPSSRTIESVALHQDRPSSALKIEDCGDGTMWLHVEQQLPWSVGLEVLKALRGRAE